MNSAAQATIENPVDVMRLREVAAFTMEFLAGAYGADGALFRILNPFEGLNCIGGWQLPPTFEAALTLMCGDRSDPLWSYRAGEMPVPQQIVGLNDIPDPAQARSCMALLASHGFADMGNMIFAEHNTVFACISLFWKNPDSRPDHSAEFTRHLRRYVEYNLARTWRRTSIGRRRVLMRGLNLTQRECDVVELLCLGRTNSDVALILGISLPTVKSHLANLFAKLSVENRSALMRVALMGIDGVRAAGEPSHTHRLC